MLIQMANIIISGLSRTVSKSFGGPKCVNIFGAKLSCYKSWELSQLLHSFFRKPCLHFVSVFDLPAWQSFFYTAAGGLLAATKARCTLLAIIFCLFWLFTSHQQSFSPSNYINTKSASSLPLMIILMKGAYYNNCSSFVNLLFIPWAY